MSLLHRRHNPFLALNPCQDEKPIFHTGHATWHSPAQSSAHLRLSKRPVPRCRWRAASQMSQTIGTRLADSFSFSDLNGSFKSPRPLGHTTDTCMKGNLATGGAQKAWLRGRRLAFKLQAIHPNLKPYQNLMRNLTHTYTYTNEVPS